MKLTLSFVSSRFPTWPKSQDKISNILRWERKDLLIWKKKHFSSFLKGFQLPKVVSGHSSQIHQIYVKLKNSKSLEYSPFDSLFENRKFRTFQLHSPSGSDFMAILRIFPAEFEEKMCTCKSLKTWKYWF